MKKALLSFQPTVEPLEARIAPAATLTFVDVDGDQVTITTSKGTDADLAAIVRFATGSDGQLQEIDLASNPVFRGTNLSITAEGSGDGKANVGYINAAGIDLGKVTVDGDVGQIDAGDTNVNNPGVKALEVGSLGALGTTTQGTDPSLVSSITGPLRSFIAHGNVQGTLEVSAAKKSAGRIDTIEIDGSLLGGADEKSGSIVASGAIGNITIHQNLEGGTAANSGYIEAKSLKSLIVEKSIIGGTGQLSGAIKIRGNIGQVQVDENVVGGTGINSTQSGQIRADGVIKSALITGQLKGGDGFNSGAIGAGLGLGTIEVKGGVLGGTGLESGAIGTKGAIASVTITGGITGGIGEKSGAILAGAKISNVTITGDMVGGSGTDSGSIATDGGIGEVTVNGSIKGGNGIESGTIGSRKAIQTVSITANLEGGSRARSGAIISSTSIGSVNIDGSVIGGTDFQSGSIGSLGQVGFVKIGGNLEGRSGGDSGSILSLTSIVKVEIDGGIVGGLGPNSGVIQSNGTIGSVDVQLNVTGGDSFHAGGIYAQRSIQNVAIHGSLIGGTAPNTGLILTPGTIASVTIDNDLIGGTFSFTGVIQGFRVDNVLIGDDIIGAGGIRSATIIASATELPPQFPNSENERQAARIIAPQPILGTIKVLGDVLGGDGAESGSIRSDGLINSVTIGREGTSEGGELSPRDVLPPGVGSLVGGRGFGSGSISAEGEIGSIKIFENLIGGDDGDLNSGRIFAGGSLQKLTILGNLVGGDSSYLNPSEGGPQEPGQVYARGRIGTVDIGNSVFGGYGQYSGTIVSGAIASISVGNSVTAGPGTYSASFIAEVQDINVIKIAGRISMDTGIFDPEGEGIVPAGTNAGSIAAARNLGRVEIGEIDGLQESHVVISAGGQVGARNDNEARAIGSVVVRSVSRYADILAGYGTDFLRSPVNPDAQIGTVTTGSPELGSSTSWINTNIVAGTIAGSDGQFGTTDDTVINNSAGSSRTISKIASVIIHGGIQDDENGISAEQIISLSVAGQKIALQSGPKNDLRTETIGGSTLSINEPKSTIIPV